MLDSSISSETNAMKGLEKLVQFYASDPVAQEKAKGELEDQRKKIQGMQDNKTDLQRQLAQLDGTTESYANNEAAEPDNAYQPEEEEQANNYEETRSEAPEAEEATPLVTLCRARALYDYKATNDTELNFNAGDILNITDRDESGWWYAELDGVLGFVPNNYVEG